MTGPTGDQPRGYWEVVRADPPHAIVLLNGLANDDGTPNTDIPLTEYEVTIEAAGRGRTRMTIESIFANPKAMEQLLAMGMEEGLKQAVGQIDAILAAIG